MPAASCKNNRGSWVSRPTAPCCSVRIRFISTVYLQILTNYFSRKPFTMKVIQNAGGIAISERTSPSRPKQAPNLYFLSSLRYHARAASDAALWLFGVSLCQQGHYPKGSAASSAISRLRGRSCAQRLTRFAAADFKSRQGGASIALFRTVVFHAASARSIGPCRADVVHYFLFGKDHGTHADHI